MTDAITNPSSPKPLLELRDIGVHFSKASGTFFKPSWVIKAVDGVSLQIAEGTTLGLVGESGCGKTTLGRTIVGLIPPHSGTIHFKGLDITNPSWGSSRRLRREMQIVFQDATGSLDPRLPVGRSIAEPLDVFSVGLPRERRDRVRALLDQVGLRAADADRYPHELSGGQRQRVGIARALALNPKLLVLDEPVSALDVSVQAQIINLLTDLQQSQGLTYLFIGHDLALIEYVSDQIVVMHEGLIVETGPAHEICQHPQHPYTQGLLSSTLHLPTRDHDPHQRVNKT